MDIKKEYLVTVETIGNKVVRATNIKDSSGNVVKSFTYDDGSETANNIVLTEIYEDKEDDENVKYEDNPSVQPINDSSIKKEDDLKRGIYGENPKNEDVIKNGNSRPISDSVFVDNAPSNNQSNNIGDYYNKPISTIDKKNTVSSSNKITEKYQGNKQPKSTHGGRKTTRKNKKKTKTMRRKRRNL